MQSQPFLLCRGESDDFNNLWVLISLVIISLFIVAVPASSDQDGGAIVKQYPDNLSYMKEYSSEYDLYIQTYEKASSGYREELGKVWDDVLLPDRKRWVEYSSDLQTRTVVDFENGYIELTHISKKGSNENLANIYNDSLYRLFISGKDTEFRNNRVILTLESELANKAKLVKTLKPDADPIFTPVMFNALRPDDKQLRIDIIKMIKSGRLQKKAGRSEDSEIVSLQIPFPSGYLQKLSQQYKWLADEYGARFGIDPALIMAVIHTESFFNPLSLSLAPVFGPMQIRQVDVVKEATRSFYGRPIIAAPSYLLDRRNNIMIGSGYLRVLTTKYLKDIKDDKNRLYCTITAYNSGLAHMSRVFVENNNIDKAVVVINKLSPEKVYAKLMSGLQSEDEREFLKSVLQKMDLYRHP